MVNPYCRLTGRGTLNRLLTSQSLLFFWIPHALFDVSRRPAGFFVRDRNYGDYFGGMFQSRSPSRASAIGQVDHGGGQ
jgi:hypothetical protein